MMYEPETFWSLRYRRIRSSYNSPNSSEDNEITVYLFHNTIKVLVKVQLPTYVFQLVKEKDLFHLISPYIILAFRPWYAWYFECIASYGSLT